ncbi:DNA methyltransferase [Pseudarthrobacter sp902506025]
MAHLDTLIAMIPDEKLRNDIQAQVSKLTAKASFGLVYQEHHPETVQLPGFKVTRGSKVVFKDGTTPGIWTVLKLADDIATIVRTGDTNERTTANVENLVLIREFGDPIYPGLKSVGSVTRGGDKPFHTVINAENFHATEMLLYPYENKIDAIYIDPPYNTGSKDWKYNNDYVDTEDTYRHSKWLAMMERRLKVAQRLLNPRGSVLIVTIDEKEYLRLGLLLEKVFDTAKIQMVTSVINTKGVARGREFSRVEEYIYFVYIGDQGPIPTSDNMLGVPDDNAGPETIWLSMLRRGTAAARVDRPSMFYPIFVDQESGAIHSVGESLPLTADRSTAAIPDGCVAVWPLRTNGSEGRWQIGRESFIAAVAEGTARLGRRNARTGQWAVNYLNEGAKARIATGEIVVTGKDATGALIIDAHASSERLTAARTVWNRSSHDASTYGTSLLSQFLPDRKFPFPKSLYAVEDTLRFFVKDKPDATVLDFFSGSGTTAHAVMRLNHQDGGRRRSILVTNNEVSPSEQTDLLKAGLEPGQDAWEARGIFEYITMPRITAAVTGVSSTGKPIQGDYKFVDQFKMSDGFEENVEFFKLTYEDNQLVRLGRKFEAIAPILWMRAGAEGERIDVLPEDGWALPKKGFYGVLTDIDQWEPFVDSVNARDDVRCVFIVTDSQAEFEAINAQIDQGIDSVRLYSDYLQSFEINTRQG